MLEKALVLPDQEITSHRLILFRKKLHPAHRLIIMIIIINYYYYY